MEPTARKRFQRIESILESVARHQAAADVRARKADVQSRARDRRIEARYEVRVQRVEARLDKRMDSIAKLIQTGMKLIVRIEARQAKTDLRLAEVTDKLDGLISVVDGMIRRPGTPPA
jgi:hypothetical protein